MSRKGSRRARSGKRRIQHTFRQIYMRGTRGQLPHHDHPSPELAVIGVVMPPKDFVLL